jgi:hypothetical protein
VRFSFLIIEQNWIKAIDINPLLASSEGLLALDARLVLHSQDVVSPPTPAIRPYPVPYVSPWRFEDETEIRHPPDPPDPPGRRALIARFHVRLSERSVYQRYFQFINIDQRISHDRLVRVCFGDYDGEIALVAERQAPGTGQPEILVVGAGARRGGMVWLGRRIRTRGFELATFLIAVAAAATAVMATLTGLQARATVSRDAPVADLMQEHLTNGVAAILMGEVNTELEAKQGAQMGSRKGAGYAAQHTSQREEPSEICD